MGLSKELSCEAGTFSCCHKPRRFLQPEVLRLYFTVLEPWVVRSVSLPLFLRVYPHSNVEPQPLSHPPGPPATALPPVLSTPSSTPGLVEGFFFSSLIVGLPYHSIFWQFWLFFVFKFVVVLLLAVGGGKVYLPTPPSWPEVSKTLF